MVAGLIGKTTKQKNTEEDLIYGVITMVVRDTDTQIAQNLHLNTQPHFH